jgi:hypothetical protein
LRQHSVDFLKATVPMWVPLAVFGGGFRGEWKTLDLVLPQLGPGFVLSVVIFLYIAWGVSLVFLFNQTLVFYFKQLLLIFLHIFFQV